MTATTAPGGGGSGPAGTRFGVPAVLSAVLHSGLVVAVLIAGRESSRPMPPIYRVELVAAPKGPSAIGVVEQTPPAPEVKASPPPRAAAPPKNAMPVRRQPAARQPATRATPTPVTKTTPKNEPAPKAGGGDEGGKGTDVGNIRLDGIQFPYEAYLQNIVRQIKVRFKPRAGPAVSADIAFLIRKDGTVDGIRFVKRSGAYLFDAEAVGAIEAVARLKAFGPLPEGFSEEVLPVIFSFTPDFLR